MSDKFVCPKCDKELDEVNVVTECSRPLIINKEGFGTDYSAVDWIGSDTLRIECPHCFLEITDYIQEG